MISLFPYNLIALGVFNTLSKWSQAQYVMFTRKRFPPLWITPLLTRKWCAPGVGLILRGLGHPLGGHPLRINNDKGRRHQRPPCCPYLETASQVLVLPVPRMSKFPDIPPWLRPILLDFSGLPSLGDPLLLPTLLLGQEPHKVLTRHPFKSSLPLPIGVPLTYDVCPFQKFPYN